MDRRLLVAFVLTVMVSSVMTRLVRYLSYRFQWVDRPRFRHIHHQAMATMGGLALHVSFWLVFAILFKEQFAHYTSVFVGSSLIVLTGAIDDYRELSPFQKTLGILLATVLVVLKSSLLIETIRMGNTLIFLPVWLQWLATGAWFFLLTNAMNLIDGLDGLASGVTVISLLTMGMIFYWFIFPTPFPQLVIVILMMGSLLGFLPYNFYPASIYLGDTGSLWLGFMLSVVSLVGVKSAAFVSVILPVFILALPLMDSVFSVIRRLWTGQAIFQGDRKHLHHRLLDVGLSHLQAVLAILSISLLFSLSALTAQVYHDISVIFFALAIVLAAYLIVMTRKNPKDR